MTSPSVKRYSRADSPCGMRATVAKRPRTRCPLSRSSIEAPFRTSTAYESGDPDESVSSRSAFRRSSTDDSALNSRLPPALLPAFPSMTPLLTGLGTEAPIVALLADAAAEFGARVCTMENCSRPTRLPFSKNSEAANVECSGLRGKRAIGQAGGFNQKGEDDGRRQEFSANSFRY